MPEVLKTLHERFSRFLRIFGSQINYAMNRIMGISAIAGFLIIAGSILLVLSTIPMENRLEGDTLTVRFIIGKKVIDIKDAHYLPVPEDALHHIIRVGGTSIGKKHSGNFMNTQSKTRYKFFLTGEGEKTYFEIGKEKYLVDGLK